VTTVVAHGDALLEQCRRAGVGSIVTYAGEPIDRNRLMEVCLVDDDDVVVVVRLMSFVVE
jgi:hypothetical protein